MRQVAVSILVGLALTFGTALSQDASSRYPLDGIEIEYVYTDGGAVVLTFHAGQLNYRWIAGPFEGAAKDDVPYQSRPIGDGVFLVNWHDTADAAFVTLVINLRENELYSSAILGYATEQAVALFDEAVIERIGMR